MNFWPIFILFFYLFFLKNFFIFQKFEKSITDSWRVTSIPIQMFLQIWATISNGGPGGRLAPPASKCHKKNVCQGGSFILLQIV